MSVRCWLLGVWLCASGALAYAETEPSIDLLQNIEARQSQSLDGQWSVIVDAIDVGDKREFNRDVTPEEPSDLVEYNFDSSRKLHVPGDWNTQAEDLFWYEGSVWYQRDFNVDKKRKKTYLLYFGAVNYLAKVYLNGELMGEHEGGFTPFQFDVTSHLRNGENSLVVKVNNRREPDYIPTMSTDWWNYGGITRSVHLVALDPVYVSDYTLTYLPGDAPKIRAEISMAGNVDAGDRVELLIPELEVTEPIIVSADGKGSVTIDAEPTLWSPDSPKLYDVQFAVNNEVIHDRIGFRYVEVKGTKILLNGKPIFLRGIAIHEENPRGAGRAWSETDDRTLLTWAKELNSNYVRLAHYPHNETMLRLADEMGLLVWSEIPVYWDIQFDNEAVYKKAEAQYTEMLSRDKNRASIILWSIANETPLEEARTHFLSRLVDRVHELDPTRLVTAAINTQSTTEYGRLIDDPFAEKVDVIGINTYCGWYEDAPEECGKWRWESHHDKPLIVSEFGAGALQGMHGDKEKRFTEENQLLVYQHNLMMLENMEALSGVSPWVLKDFLSARRPLANIQDYWNRKGLLSERGVKKKVWYLMQDWYGKIADEESEQGGKLD